VIQFVRAASRVTGGRVRSLQHGEEESKCPRIDYHQQDRQQSPTRLTHSYNVIRDSAGQLVESAIEQQGTVPTALFSSKDDGPVARQVRWRLLRAGRSSLWVPLVPLLVMVAAGLVSFYAQTLVGIISVAIVLPLVASGLWKMWRSPNSGVSDAQLVGIFLDAQRCPSCFYNLSGHTAAEDNFIRCPECASRW